VHRTRTAPYPPNAPSERRTAVIPVRSVVRVEQPGGLRERLEEFTKLGGGFGLRPLADLALDSLGGLLDRTRIPALPTKAITDCQVRA
jgi:hypothetical protein